MWKIFPSFVQKAFQQSFSQESLLNGKNRLLENEWFNILARLKSSIVRCPHCGEEMFLESDKISVCQSCKKSVKAVGYLKFPKRANREVTVPIFKGALLYDYHINSASEDFDTEVAVVLEKPGKFGLKNDSKIKWLITAPGGKTFARQAGETQILVADCKIDFGKNTAQVIVNN